MPSHIAHLLCAEDALPAPIRPALTRADVRGALAVGAQGPDIFYHNQRRRPTSIQYGTLLHRRGYGAVVHHMIGWAVRHGHTPTSPLGAYILGFVTHAVLDRRMHPYINYRSGWVVPGTPETKRYRSMHAFLERLIDVALIRELRGIEPNELDFYGIVTHYAVADPVPEAWHAAILHGLTESYERAAGDERLAKRLENAWRDSLGYYEFTRRIDDAYLREAIEREDRGEVRSSWLSIIHPPSIPADIDVLNHRHEEWTHPCSSKRRSTASVPEMYDDAVMESRSILTTIVDEWERWSPENGTFAEIVGDHNLSDGRRRKRPCRPRHMEPFPLAELQARIRESIRRGDGGRL